MTDLSIIIVCYKGWERFNKCLDALDSFKGEHLKTEVIVVDNKSGEETIHKTEERFPKFRFINNDINGGFANGCNIGAKIASGEFILFLNPDTVASEPEIEKLLRTAKQNPEFGIVSCRQVNEKGKESIAYGQFPSMFNLTGFQRAIFGQRHSATGPEASLAQPMRNPQSEISFPDWVSGSVILIRRETFNRLCGFDEDFWMYFEDIDLCRRVRDNDGEIAFCRDITIEHNHGGSSRINLKTTSLTKTEVSISRHVYISKHKTGAEKLLIQAFLILNNLISGGIMALIGLLMFFIPKVFSRTLIYCRLIRYYTGSLFRLSWISPRSVNFSRK
ncbi:MAG: glycosyltransferase family 2 protein [Bacteroidales bacterium]|jgi:GT2 family glycosyltransferase